MGDACLFSFVGAAANGGCCSFVRSSATPLGAVLDPGASVVSTGASGLARCRSLFHAVACVVTLTLCAVRHPQAAAHVRCGYVGGRQVGVLHLPVLDLLAPAPSALSAPAIGGRGVSAHAGRLDVYVEVLFGLLGPGTFWPGSLGALLAACPSGFRCMQGWAAPSPCNQVGGAFPDPSPAPVKLSCQDLEARLAGVQVYCPVSWFAKSAVGQIAVRLPSGAQVHRHRWYWRYFFHPPQALGRSRFSRRVQAPVSPDNAGAHGNTCSLTFWEQNLAGGSAVSCGSWPLAGPLFRNACTRLYRPSRGKHLRPLLVFGRLSGVVLPVRPPPSVFHVELAGYSSEPELCQYIQ